MEKVKHYSYARVSSSSQSNDAQRLFLHEYSRKHEFVYTSMLETVVSSRKNNKDRDIDKLLSILNSGDHLYIYAIDRISRNVRQLLNIVNLLQEKKVNIHILKDNLHILVDDHNPMTVLLLQMLAMFAELERNILSERTKHGMLVAKQNGKLLGKPVGAISHKTIFEPHKEKIYQYLELGLSYKKIVKIIGVGSSSALYSFVKNRRKSKT